jgi:cytochrome c oxidase accessory protein FixG
MLDRQSLIVAYDPNRGEPRKKGRRQEGDVAGDCVDCNQCVVVCPTGIDIRNGLQMECINCTQCIDACNNVMDRVGSPRGLIRYSSQDALAGKPAKLLRVRTVAYPLLLAAVVIAFVAVLSTKYAFDANLMRGRGNPFQRTTAGVITNNFRMRLTNRTEEPQTYSISVIEPVGARLRGPSSEPVELKGRGTTLVPVLIEVPATRLGPLGQCNGKLQITDEIGNQRHVTMKLLGPRT